MLQITVDPSGLTAVQREALAGFLLMYPGAAATTLPGKTAHIEGALRNSGESIAMAVGIGQNTAHARAALVNEAASLQADTDRENAELAAGAPPPSGDTPDPAAAFAGANAAPLPPGAIAAPSTVAAEPSPTAQEPAAGAPPPPGIQAPAVPPAPPAPGAPSAPAPPATSAPVVETDKNGLPWNAEIHAGSKAKNQDGTWRYKQKLDPAIKARVEAELKALMSVAAAPGAAPTGNEKAAYVALIGRASAAMKTGKVTEAEINACVAHWGIARFPLLGNRLDLVAQVAPALDALIASKG